MKKLALSVLCSLFVLASFSQSPSPIVGKWKIVIVDAGIYHDFKKDSTSLSEEAKASLSGSKDSAFTMGFLQGMIKQFADYYFNFKADGTYDEIKGEKIKQKGSYTFSTEKKLLTQVSKNALGDESKKEMRYTLEGKTLTVVPVEEAMKLKFVLEKQD